MNQIALRLSVSDLSNLGRVAPIVPFVPSQRLSVKIDHYDSHLLCVR